MKLAMEHLEKENVKMGVDENEEVKRYNKIKAHHILSNDQKFKKKCMHDSVVNFYIPYLRSKDRQDDLNAMLNAIQN